jgi:hypothetical protein
MGGREGRGEEWRWGEHAFKYEGIRQDESSWVKMRVRDSPSPRQVT